MKITEMVEQATHQAHRALCVDQGDCDGPSEVELMITAMVLESTVPQIMRAVTQELRQALHGLAVGQPDRGDNDALAEDPEKLLAEWFQWWSKIDGPIWTPPDMLTTRTAAYLAARNVEQGLPVRAPYRL